MPVNIAHSNEAWDQHWKWTCPILSTASSGMSLVEMEGAWSNQWWLRSTMGESQPTTSKSVCCLDVLMKHCKSRGKKNKERIGNYILRFSAFILNHVSVHYLIFSFVICFLIIKKIISLLVYILNHARHGLYRIAPLHFLVKEDKGQHFAGLNPKCCKFLTPGKLKKTLQ